MMMFFFNKLLKIPVEFVQTKYQQVESGSPYYTKHVRRLTTYEWGDNGEFSPPTTVSQYKEKLKIQLDPQILLDLLIAEIRKY